MNIQPVNSIYDERESVDWESWVNKHCPSTGKILFDVLAEMAKEQSSDVYNLECEISQLFPSAKNHMNLALACIKTLVLKNQESYQEYLLDGIAPDKELASSEHGLRHALQVLFYAVKIMQKQSATPKLEDKSLQYLVWSAFLHDISCTVKHSRKNHEIESANIVDQSLTQAINDRCIPQGYDLNKCDVKHIVNAIKGHNKSLGRDDSVYNYEEALAIRDADLLASSLHISRFVRIHKMNLFLWTNWKFFDPNVDLENRLLILNTGKDKNGKPKSAHSIDAILDFVKNVFWKINFFHKSSDDVVQQTGRNIDDESLFQEMKKFINWASKLGLPKCRLENTGTTQENLGLIKDCIQKLYEKRP
jgi:HD superfamily phosphodiesterase